MVKNAKKLEKTVYKVPDELDKRVAKLKLESMSIKIDKLTPEQEEYLAGWSEGTQYSVLGTQYSEVSHCGAARAAPFCFWPSSRALLGRVPDMQDFDRFFLHAIGNDVRQPLMQQLARPIDGSRPSATWKFLEGEDSLSYGNHCGPRKMRLVFPKIDMDLLQVFCGGERPADAHQDWSIRSMRASISCSSTKSPRSACSTPLRTEARKCASRSSRRRAAFFTNCSASVPA